MVEQLRQQLQKERKGLQEEIEKLKNQLVCCQQEADLKHKAHVCELHANHDEAIQKMNKKLKDAHEMQEKTIELVIAELKSQH